MNLTSLPPVTRKGALCRLAGATGRLAKRCHRDQSGSISILSVFAVLSLTMLLGMVMNVGRQVDGKLRMQNAADAAAYSGGLVFARGLNSLAFTNHLLCEVFAMTAWMREARDAADAAKYVPDILAAWEKEATVFAGSTFPKFQALGNAIPAKAQAEQALVTAFTNWAAALAGDGQDGGALWLMETILRDHMITNYQQAVVSRLPEMAQQATMTVAGQNGQPDYGRGPMAGVLWHAYTGQPVDAAWVGSIVADPNSDPSVASDARQRRNQCAQQYLGMWNNWVLAFFDYGAKMSQFGQLWRHYSQCQFDKLLTEYADSNLPVVLTPEIESQFTPNLQWQVEHYETQMDRYFTFLGVVYWNQTPQLLPGLYRSPVASDALAYAEVRVFVPSSRLVWRASVPVPPGGPPMGGVPGYQWPTPNSTATAGPATWGPGRQHGVNLDWNLWNQHWTCQIVPATHLMASTILQTSPPVSMLGQSPPTLPNLAGVNADDLAQINHH